MLALLALLATQPGILRTVDVPISDPGAPALKTGGALVVWPIACESSGECTPAKLFLPSSAQSPLGDGTSAAMFLSRLGKCFQSSTKRAPDDVTAAVKNGDDAALRTALAAQSRRTVVVVARESWDGGHNFDVSLHTADDNAVLSPSSGTLHLSVVRAPHAKAVVHAIARKQWRTALALAKHAYVHARAGDEKMRAAGNYAVAAVLAGDKSAAADAALAAQMPINDVVDDTTSAAVQAAYEDVANADSFATGAVVISDPCS